VLFDKEGNGAAHLRNLGRLQTLSNFRIKQGHLVFDAKFDSDTALNLQLMPIMTTEERLNLLEEIQFNDLENLFPNDEFVFFRGGLRRLLLSGILDFEALSVDNDYVVTTVFRVSMTEEQARQAATARVFARDLTFIDVSEAIKAIFDEARDQRAAVNE
jgi:hypothetical protein